MAHDNYSEIIVKYTLIDGEYVWTVAFRSMEEAERFIASARNDTKLQPGFTVKSIHVLNDMTQKMLDRFNAEDYVVPECADGEPPYVIRWFN